MQTRTVGEHRWLRQNPPEQRDIRKRLNKFWKRSQAAAERGKRVSILADGNKTDRRLARALKHAMPGKPAAVYCCPVLARRFQIFFVNRALRVDELAESQGIPITLLDPKNAVPFGKLEDIDWRRLHGQTRRRLERMLGKGVRVVGMGEVEADYELKVWQPHHHLVIYGATKAKLKALREAYYQRHSDCEKPMLISRGQDLADWYAYASKLITFRKLECLNSETGRAMQPRVVRLKATEFRELMRYLAGHVPTSLVFAMNCRIVR